LRQQFGPKQAGSATRARPVTAEGLFDQFAFAFERGTFKLDLECLAEDFHRVGIRVQRASDACDQVIFFGELSQRFFDHRFASAGTSDHQAQSALLAVDTKRVVDFLLVR